ncbi:hypothetical protein BIW11_06016 [Tropilaelaps mercedesae]|uniref:Uncharacterized protein n=1 Tax=Tropilaelaps mercedesae TaxID=418985 RepID=A0A1V9XZY6_9ACAR|nr:hypothetical protein BIW11_06016 [Tropilaelaps mercedesae]
MNVDQLNAALTKGRELLVMSQDVRSLAEAEIDRVKDTLWSPVFTGLADKLKMTLSFRTYTKTNDFTSRSKRELTILTEMVESVKAEQYDTQKSIQKSHKDVALAESPVRPDFAGALRDITALGRSYRQKKTYLDQLNEWIEQSSKFVHNHLQEFYAQLDKGIEVREQILDDIEAVLNSSDSFSQETFMSLANASSQEQFVTALSTLNENDSIGQKFAPIGVEPPTPINNRLTNAKHDPIGLLTDTPIGATRPSHLLVPSKNIEGHSMESGVSLTSACSTEDFRVAKEV